jgi:hypothetical protein
MNEDKAVIIVDWILTHWVAVLIGLAVVVVSAFLVALLTEWRKKHISKKTEEKVEGWLIQKTLAFTAVLFGGLEYLLPFVQHNIGVLSGLKYVGAYVVATYAAANYLYSWKFKGWFKTVQSYLEARRDKLAAKKASDAQTEQPQQPVLPPAPAPSTPFEESV